MSRVGEAAHLETKVLIFFPPFCRNHFPLTPAAQSQSKIIDFCNQIYVGLQFSLFYRLLYTSFLIIRLCTFIFKHIKTVDDVIC